eukprot:GILJ01004904.1.p1 GENE.GILJ01004904.1~~GILJ01004904.1.p1  ORF type:complete len:265 (+),score=38.83 GILJ01004904.1:46-795(+)
MSSRCTRKLRLLVACSAIILLLSATVGEAKTKSSSKAIQKKDLPYIRCQACQLGVENAFERVDHLASTKSGAKLTESDIDEIVEKTCTPLNENGRWIRHYDIVEESGHLKLVKQDGPGKCETECLTIAAACEDALEDQYSDISGGLVRGKTSRDKIKANACEHACRKDKSSKKFKHERTDSPFEPVDPQSLQMEEMQELMGSISPGAQMYGRDEMDEMLASMKDQEGDNGIESMNLPPTSTDTEHTEDL